MAATSIFRKRKTHRPIPLLWLLPSLLLILVVVVYPILELLYTSLSHVTLSGLRKGWNNFANYAEIFRSETFYTTLRNTVIWTIGVVGLSTLFSLGIALLMNENFPGRKIVRAALLIPWAVSLVITSAIFKYIFDYNYGTLNLILSKLGLISENIYWLARPASSFPLMIFVGIFVTIPFTTFVLLSGLQSISHDLYEAAGVDGANGWQKFTHVTLPLLKPALTISTVLNTIYVFNSFPIVWTITRGDPAYKTDLVMTYLYKLAFQSGKMGPAAAISTISFIVLFLFAIVYVSLMMRGEKDGR
jgi:multiple sugar transport system permease protein